MAHELRAAGHGYLWPRMLFASDGDSVQVWAVQSRPETKAPVRYLSNSHGEISAGVFERAIDAFVAGVLARLNAVSIEHTALHELWSEILDERHDKGASADRKLEAMLGFDPDEAPNEVLKHLKALIRTAGSSAISEIAPVCATGNRAEILNKIVSMVDAEGVSGRILLKRKALVDSRALPGWQRGREFAREVRAVLGLNGSPVSDDQLCDLVGVDEKVIREGMPPVARMPLGIAVRTGDETVKFVLRKRRPEQRRFEMARFICDHLISDHDDRWLPTTDQKTSRQKAQRAFAGEFLCPIDSLTEFLQDDFSNDAIDEAAEYFRVSPRAVETQLVNHHILPSEILSARDGWFDFPYSSHADGGWREAT
ncbi:MAG: hypothetical protein WDO68_08675 [Gammaproteobacteria bacterium]